MNSKPMSNSFLLFFSLFFIPLIFKDVFEYKLFLPGTFFEIIVFQSIIIADTDFFIYGFFILLGRDSVLTIHDSRAWKQKAMAFVTRCHRHLWGKNNEDPLVFLYHQGLTHDFIRQMHLGWNKHAQQRDLTKWGLSDPEDDLSRFLLPPGIVLPCIVEKNLQSVAILAMNSGCPPCLVPGSRHDIILGDGSRPPVLCDDILTGLQKLQASGTPVRLHLN